MLKTRALSERAEFHGHGLSDFGGGISHPGAGRALAIRTPADVERQLHGYAGISRRWVERWDPGWVN